jgi:NTE family protein
MKDNNLKQRALILQGGGSLGAYEVGVVNVLYHWIKKDCNENDNIFDIIAGTSIGAINAAIMTSYSIERRKKDHTLSIKDSWNGVIKHLLSFWEEISSLTAADVIPFYEEMWNISRSMSESFLNNTSYWSNLLAYSNPFLSVSINQWLDFLKTNFEIPARGEAARRFYSAKEFLLVGANNVFRPIIPKLDTKFYYNIPILPNNIWYNYDNSWLEKTLTKYVTFPITTSFYSENYDDNVSIKVNNEYNNLTAKDYNGKYVIKQPRLLVVSVDIQAGATVSFDSYEYSERKCPICLSKDIYQNKKEIELNQVLIQHIKTLHFDFVKMDQLKQLRLSTYEDPNNSDNYDNKEKYVMFYNEGIKSEHIMASASIPIFYNYRKLVANKYDTQGNFLSNQERYFWDGQLLSNTPLRELISGHTLYWRGKIGDSSLLNEILKFYKDDYDNGAKNYKKLDPIELSQVPDLEVYIANVWPSREEDIPTDHDLILDRKNDIGNHDKTIYDEKTSELVTDYIDLCKILINTIATNDNSEIEEILENNTTSILREGNKRKYKDLLIGKFEEDATSILREGNKRKYKDLLIGKFAISKVTRIERQDDPDSISEKWADLSKKTIDQLINQGIKDTVFTLITEIVKSLNIKHIEYKKKEKLYEILNDVKYYDHEKRNIIYNKFVNELKKYGYDEKINEKNYDIIKSIDALIEGPKLYHSNKY